MKDYDSLLIDKESMHRNLKLKEGKIDCPPEIHGNVIVGIIVHFGPLISYVSCLSLIENISIELIGMYFPLVIIIILLLLSLYIYIYIYNVYIYYILYIIFIFIYI